MPNLATIPPLSGVYFFKDAHNTIIYIGKAKNLYNRVRSYFRPSDEYKIQQLRARATSVNFIVTKNEIEALLLEAVLIKRHQPRLNVLLKYGNAFSYILFTRPQQNKNKNDKKIFSALPSMTLTNKPPRSGAAANDCFGPFVHRHDARLLYDYLLRTLQLSVCNKTIANGCLDYHIGRCCGSCRPDFDHEAYEQRLALAKNILAGEHEAFIKTITTRIAACNTALKFEQSRQLHALQCACAPLFATIATKFSVGDYAAEVVTIMIDPVKGVSGYAQAAAELQTLLGLSQPPLRIDCFDISHFQGHCMVGSCVRFTNGLPDAKNFRKFRIKTVYQQDDYASLVEIVRRRYKSAADVPDLILIDGGKGQRNAVLPVVTAPCVSLAKKEERLFSDAHPDGIPLTAHTAVGKLLIALRDYAHHFAITYHGYVRKEKFLEKK